MRFAKKHEPAFGVGQTELRKQAVINHLDACAEAAESGDRSGYANEQQKLKDCLKGFNIQCRHTIEMLNPREDDKVVLSL